MNAFVGLRNAAARFTAAWRGAAAASSDTSHHGASRRSKELAGWNLAWDRRTPIFWTNCPIWCALPRSRAKPWHRRGRVPDAHRQRSGHGLVLAANPDYKALGRDKEWAADFRNAVEAVWRPWAQHTYGDVTDIDTFAEVTSLVARSWFENGEVLALPLWVEDSRTPFRTKLQLVEADRLSNPDGVMDTRRMRAGIEIDDYGRPVRYHIQKTHPGDAYAYGMTRLAREWEAIPAVTEWGRKRVVHAFFRDRVGQNRGKPVLTAILPQFKMWDHYQRTEMQAAVVNALVAALIETPMTAEDVGAMVGTDPDAYMQGVDERLVPLRGAAMMQLPPGTKLNPFIPSRPSPQFATFMETVARHLGAGLNLPYELLLKDWSKTNYSSARAALLEAWRFFRGRRTRLADKFCMPIYELWFEEAVHLGLLPLTPAEYYGNREAYMRCKWIGPGRGWIDPVKEAEAARIRMESGLSTLEDECAEQGNDWEEVMEQRARRWT